MATEKTAMMVAFLLLLRSMSWGRGEGKELGKVAELDSGDTACATHHVHLKTHHEH